ncbi:hypothetical protein MAH1_36490 [Sessilibacter sp. MAH1]
MVSRSTQACLFCQSLIKKLFTKLSINGAYEFNHKNRFISADEVSDLKEEAYTPSKI